jgi:hypothetical protein
VPIGAAADGGPFIKCLFRHAGSVYRIRSRLAPPGFGFFSHSDPPTSKTTTMGKSQDSKKQTKKAPLKTPAEKKAAKREKKNSR